MAAKKKVAKKKVAKKKHSGYSRPGCRVIKRKPNPSLRTSNTGPRVVPEDRESDDE